MSMNFNFNFNFNFNRLHILPNDILKYKIYHLLDWESRISFNKVIPISARNSKKFTKNQINQHSAQAVCNELASKTIAINECNESIPTRTNMIINYFENLCNPLNQHALNIYRVKEGVILKCSEFYNCELISLEQKQILNETIDKLLSIVSKYQGSVKKPQSIIIS